jgi:hypothetical protein
MEPSIRPKVYYFKCATWAWGSYIEVLRYLRSIISIDVVFFSGRYEGRLLMACGYDAENQLILLTFALVENFFGELELVYELVASRNDRTWTELCNFRSTQSNQIIF